MAENTTAIQAHKICRNLLEFNLPVTSDKISEAIDKVKIILPGLTTQDEKDLHNNLSSELGIMQDAPKILDDHTTVPWSRDKWAENYEKREFWVRYRDYLSDEKKFPPAVISRLDDLTNDILDRLADPEAHDQFDKRGLVVGNVQSGKTSNYIGLIAKAADAGFKLIVVLTGIHSSLRSQTQLRIDEGFLGYDTETNRSFNKSNNRIGVGKINRNVPAHSLTSSALNGDFKKTVAEAVNFSLKSNDPIIVVIKKNNSVLKNLIQWLDAKEGQNYGEQERIINEIPLLLIDDEADNASINISKDGVSAINGSIRAMLELFRKSAYVGYTATPYANVFIPPPDNQTEEVKKGIKVLAGNKIYKVGEDLFPRNFIINIPPPTNYIGPEKVFGIVSEDFLHENDDLEDDYYSPLNLYKTVDDYQPKEYTGENTNTTVKRLRLDNHNYIPDKHRKDDAKPSELPESLKEAIQCFILSCAARRARGQKDVHNSMLIHVTRFVDWQNHITELVGNSLNKYRQGIEFTQKTTIESLKEIWEREYINKTKEVIGFLDNLGNKDSKIREMPWEQLEKHLFPAVIKIQLRAVHGSKLLGGLEADNIQPLDYYESKKGLSVIAVGGNKLSRGLTLEGLTISYYLRSSKMYDTLMQMGRWFGYRPGYLDLCRLFTSNELVSNYKHIARATIEMKAEFDRMALLKKQPFEYGLKVRAHTGVLSITASNKFRYRKMMNFSYSGALEETWLFDKTNEKSFYHNHKLTQSFLSELGAPTGPLNESSHLKSQPNVWTGKNNANQIIDFLYKYQTVQPTLYIPLITEYIIKQVKHNKLENWTIALVNNSIAKGEKEVDFYGDFKTGLSYRRDTADEGSSEYRLAKSHIIGNFHEYIDLDNNQLNKALLETKEDRIAQGRNPENVIHPSPLRIRRNRSDKNGLLLIYPLDPKPNKQSKAYSKFPIIGLALSFPYIDKDEKVSYAINDVFINQLDYARDLDRDEEEEDPDIQEFSSKGRKLSKETYYDSLEFGDNDEDFDRKNLRAFYLDDTEFQSGITPNYSHSDDLEHELSYNTNIVVSASTSLNKKVLSLPYYGENEIQRHFLSEETENKVLQPRKRSIFNGDYIIGIKRSKYVTFSYHDKEALFSESCWVIRSNRFSSKYLTALFNSTIFGAWVRVCGQQKKDSYFITNEVIASFPIQLPLEEDRWLFDNLFELLVSIGKLERVNGSGTISTYYSKILDALTFCLYLPESLADEYNEICLELKKHIPKVLSSEAENEILAKNIQAKLYLKDNPVRKVLFYLDDHPKVNRIKSVFNQ